MWEFHKAVNELSENSNASFPGQWPGRVLWKQMLAEKVVLVEHKKPEFEYCSHSCLQCGKSHRPP